MNVEELTELIAEKESALFDMLREGGAGDAVSALADELHQLKRDRVKAMQVAGWSQDTSTMDMSTEGS